MVIEKEGDINVVEAANKRIKNAFDTGLDLAFSISGGKDSIVLAEIILGLLKKKEIDPKRLEVNFIDEEAMFDDVIEIVKKLRKRFMLFGVKFNWYCIQVLHFNCLDRLSAGETYICWDEEAKGRWVREMPEFAIQDDPLLKKREENYQSFLTRKDSGKISIIGLRTAESVQRKTALATMFKNSPPGSINPKRASFYPIFDWKDWDVWRFIKERKLDFPITYMRLYETGTPRSRMRISQFFSVDTAKVLVKLSEYDDGLMERVERRHPNAYIAALYWDSEMFRRSTPSRRKNEEGEEVNYKEKIFEIYRNPEKHVQSKGDFKTWTHTRRRFAYLYGMMEESDFRNWYNMIIGGDPKRRTLRGIMTKIWSRRNG